MTSQSRSPRSQTLAAAGKAAAEALAAAAEAARAAAAAYDAAVSVVALSNSAASDDAAVPHALAANSPTMLSGTRTSVTGLLEEAPEVLLRMPLRSLVIVPCPVIADG